MLITNQVTDIKFYCDVVELLSKANFLFFGQFVQEYLAPLNEISPPCKTLFSGTVKLSSKTAVATLPSISFISGNYFEVLDSARARELNISILVIEKCEDCFSYIKIWNGYTIVDLIYRDAPTIFSEADNLIWSAADGFGFLHEPEIKPSSLFIPYHAEIFGMANALARRCSKKITTMYEFDIEIILNMYSRGWLIENILTPITLKPGESKTCMICLNDFNEEEPLVTNCGRHAFHQNCMISWWKKAEIIYGCAACRNELVIKSPLHFDDVVEIELELP